MSRDWTRSRSLLERANGSLAGGVSSPFRAQAPVPLYFTGGKGSRLVDADGNEYIDYLLSWGPSILGHAHPAIVDAVRKAAEGPHALGAQHELEIRVAERIQQLVPCAELVAFCSSGSEAVQLAHRLARAFTGRNLILKFEGHYHGWMDGALVGYRPTREQLGPLNAPPVLLGSPGQVANAAENTIVAPWNRIEPLREILERHAGRVAGIIMEPVLCNSGCILPEQAYLAEVHELARRHGALLIFDEVITGFRMGLGGAQEHYGVIPDIATFGKAVGGGLPLSVVAGRREVLRQMFDSGVVFGGTFNGNPISLAAADAALTELARDGGAALKNANALGNELMSALRSAAAEAGVPLKVTGFGAAMALHFGNQGELRDYRDTLNDDREALRRFMIAALAEGIHMVPDGRMYVSAAHTARDIEETVAACARAMDAVFERAAGQSH